MKKEDLCMLLMVVALLLLLSRNTNLFEGVVNSNTIESDTPSTMNNKNTNSNTNSNNNTNNNTNRTPPTP